MIYFRVKTTATLANISLTKASQGQDYFSYFGPNKGDEEMSYNIHRGLLATVESTKHTSQDYVFAEQD